MKECKCKIDYVYGEYELNQCHLCKAAPDLLAACEDIQNARDRAEPFGGMIFQQALDNVETVIKAANAVTTQNKACEDGSGRV